MNVSIELADQKIKNILKDLREAHAHSEKFYAKQLNPGESTRPMNIYDMALAFENEQKLFIDLELARSERYPVWYSSEKIVSLVKEREKLIHRIRAWRNRQFPSQSKG